MTDGLEAQAAAAARELIDLDVDQLYGELEIRRRMLADDARIPCVSSRGSDGGGFTTSEAVSRSDLGSREIV